MIYQTPEVESILPLYQCTNLLDKVKAKVQYICSLLTGSTGLVKGWFDAPSYLVRDLAVGWP